MIRVALFPNESKPETLQVAQKIATFFRDKKVAVYAPDDIADSCASEKISTIEHNQLTFLITMGGDGTIIRLAHKYRELNIPILGVNLGYLGFMADVPLTDLEPSLLDLINGEYQIEKRIILQGTLPNNQTYDAINDFVFHRARNPSLIEVSVETDGRLINSFKADGLVIATPNGSTAYSLAAGGPILTPDLEGFVITPISAHTISNRPIVVSADQTLTVSYLAGSHPLDVVADGHISYELPPGESVKLRKSKTVFKLLNLNRRDYFSTLRSKLNWSGKLPHHLK